MLVDFNFPVSLALKDEVISAIISDGRFVKVGYWGCAKDEERWLGFAPPPLNLVLGELVFGVFSIIFSFELKFIKLIVDDFLVVEWRLITIGMNHKK